MAPRDEAMLVHMLRTALVYDEGPVALRYPRGAGAGVELPSSPHPLDDRNRRILREGERVALLGYGTGVGKASRPHRCSPSAGSRDRRRRAVREADRCGSRCPARRGARAARHSRGGRAGGRLWLSGVGRRSHDARRRAPGSCGSGSPIATSPRRPGAPARGGRFSPVRGSPNGSKQRSRSGAASRAERNGPPSWRAVPREERCLRLIAGVSLDCGRLARRVAGHRANAA